MDRGAWRAAVHGKELDTPEPLSLIFKKIISQPPWKLVMAKGHSSGSRDVSRNDKIGLQRQLEGAAPTCSVLVILTVPSFIPGSRYVWSSDYVAIKCL